MESTTKNLNTEMVKDSFTEEWEWRYSVGTFLIVGFYNQKKRKEMAVRPCSWVKCLFL